MSILDDFLSTHLDNQLQISRRDLLMFTIAVLREVEEIESSSNKPSGKAAIEFLLNMKYEIVGNRALQSHTKDILLTEMDRIINKVVVKYQIKRRGKNFFFDESLAVTEPNSLVIGSAGTDLLADLYAANTELNTLRIQLAKTDLNSSSSFRLIDAIKDVENRIKEIKLEITKQKYFSHVYDQNQTSKWNSVYRRSLGEEDESRAGTVLGTAASAGAGGYLGKKIYPAFLKNKAEKTLEKTVKKKYPLFIHPLLKKAQADHEEGWGLKAQAIRNSDGKLYKKGSDLVKKAASDRKQAVEKVAKMMGEPSSKVNLKRAGLKGALVGAALGAGAYGVHKLRNRYESLSERLFDIIYKL